MIDEPLNMALDYDTRTDGQPVYQGFALPGTGSGSTIAQWRINQNFYSAEGFMIARLWASGNQFMDKKWTDRATYPYS
jgi:hypothetical protein